MNAAPEFSATVPDSDNPTVQWPGEIFDGQRTTYGLAPSALLQATARQLILRGGAREYRFPRDRVWKVSRGDFYPWLFNSVQIRHGVPEHPNDMQFKPSNAGVHEILDRLRRLGYPAA